MTNCAHCKNGWFDPKGTGPYFGEDVECVNGVLIDIDVYYEGRQRDFCYPVAPCHPDYGKQCADPENWVSDCDDVQSRLENT